jgi:aminopeptidase-like protein
VSPDGAELYDLAARLYPIGRSLTGDGVRRTLALVSEWAPLELTEIPSGTTVYDWIVPPEWNLRGAWIQDDTGARIVDAADSALHVVGYSEPVQARFTGAELLDRLHTLPDHPDRIPYRTSYYERTWGFCVAESLRRTVDPGRVYDVTIDATLDAGGSLTYGEHLIRGSRGDAEILVSTYVCHPNLANDNVAGIAVATGLARTVAPGQLESDLRIVFTPSGVGTLAWLQRNEERLGRIRGGLVVACAGDRGPLNYKQSRRGDAVVDRAAAEVLGRRPDAAIRPFVPWGTDERQYCSPGFDLPVGLLTRTPNGAYSEYHTSADALDLLTSEALADSLSVLREIIETIDVNTVYTRVEGRGEPHLSRHSLEGSMTRELMAGGDEDRQAIFWVLNLADGSHDLLDIARRAQLPFGVVRTAAAALRQADLIVAARP